MTLISSLGMDILKLNSIFQKREYQEASPSEIDLAFSHSSTHSFIRVGAVLAGFFVVVFIYIPPWAATSTEQKIITPQQCKQVSKNSKPRDLIFTFHRLTRKQETLIITLHSKNSANYKTCFNIYSSADLKITRKNATTFLESVNHRP